MSCSYLLRKIKVHNLVSTPHYIHSTVKGMCKVILHKSCGEQFLWNINWYLDWFWTGWQYWKKNRADNEQLMREIFPCLHGQSFFIFSNNVESELKHCIKWRWFFFLNNYKFLIGYRNIFNCVFMPYNDFVYVMYRVH